MVIIAPILTTITATNAATVANISAMKRRGSSGGSQFSKRKEIKRKEPSAFLKQKFEKAWKDQEERLSKLKIFYSKDDSYESNEGSFCERHNVYKYANGKPATIEDVSIFGSSKCIYDESGNCISEKRYDNDDIETYSMQCVYYKGTNQKEFEWNNKGILHFDRNGKEDTQLYKTKQKIASKRIAYEGQTGKTLQKMGKLEKAVAIALKNTKEMTIIEKMLAKEVKKSQGK